MKTHRIYLQSLTALGVFLCLGAVVAQEHPPTVTAQPRPASGESFVYEQKPLAIAPSPLSPQQSQEIVERFRAAYPKLGGPRILIYVNRELVDGQSGMKLAGRTERTVNVRGSDSDAFAPDPKAAPGTNVLGGVTIKAGGDVIIAEGARVGAGQRQPGKGTASLQRDAQVSENTYQFRERRQLTTDEKQQERDMEMAVGRPLRAAGATVVDQRVASQLLGGRPLKPFTASTEGEQARKDREAIGKIADVVIEILVGQKTITAREVSGDYQRVVFTVHATAVRLKDARILGQSSSEDLLGARRQIESNRLYPNYAPAQLAEAAALLLMDNMTVEAGRERGR
ncbi:MAG: hypothetical protein FJ388_01090 [Verrucomicrobia bacterium]|nr:hypothetical protein [Verrucomicrobiota bacterium]